MADYADIAELRDYLRISEGDAQDDTVLTVALASASRAVETATNRSFELAGASATARIFTARYDQRLQRYVVPVDDFMTTTGLAVAVDWVGDGDYDTAIDVANIRTAPVNATVWNQLISNDMLPLIELGVQVTAKWGWDAVPSLIKHATLIQAARLVKRRDAPFGVAGSPEMGNELRLLAKLDPDVELLVASYRRWWSAA